MDSKYKKLETFDLILTPNQRLARQLKQQYGEYKSHLANGRWASLNIQAMGSFITTLWQEAIDSGVRLPLLLSDQQCLAWWHDVIANDVDLINPKSTAKTAYSAWQLLQHWQISLEVCRGYNNDCESFFQWGARFSEFLTSENACDSASLINELLHVADELETFPSIALIGFSDISPALTLLLEKLGGASVNLDFTLEDTDCLRFTASDNEHEILTMARWAKQQLLNENTPLACVVPELSQQRELLLSIFKEVFVDVPFNISSGLAFNQFPIIKTALQSLTLSKEVPFAIASHWIRSPYLAYASEEQFARNKLDLHLRETQGLHWSQNTILNAAKDIAPKLHAAISQWQSIISTNQAKSLSAWAQQFTYELHALGWPGDVKLNSEEYQCVNRWLELLNEFASLETVLGELERKQALRHLILLAENTLFQVQTTDERVQVLGALEAAGNQYQALWIMGLDDSTWPPPPSANPFIPFPVQDQYQMPHATSARELQFTQHLTALFAKSAPQVIFSHSQQNEDIALRVSALISDIPVIDETALTLCDFSVRAEKLYATRQLEHFRDDIAPAVAPNERTSGASSLLELQASCPFRAFTHFRLHAVAIEEPEGGVNALNRGILLHAALEYFWRDVQTQTRLLSYTEDEYQKRIEQAVDKAIVAEFPEKTSFRQSLVIERERLCALLSRWLNYEKTRPDFSVSAMEEQIKVTLGEMTFNLRVDRVDIDADGHTIILDYKSGVTRRNNWFEEKLSQPQLPLYAVAMKEIDAISFVQLNSSELKFNGVARDEDVGIKGIVSLDKVTDVENWYTQLQIWKQQLETTANAFMQGDARVAPKDSATCQYCNLQAFCRI